MNAVISERERTPDKQQCYTFGDTPAALRLKEEIDNPGCRYKAAVVILTMAEERANDLFQSNIDRPWYWLLLLRNEVDNRLAQTACDDVIKSLCRNIFFTKVKLMGRDIQNAGCKTQ